MATDPEIFESDHAADTLLTDEIARAWPIGRWLGVGVVIGCSGGADSVALVQALSEIRASAKVQPFATGFLVVAHFNHGLRGHESDGDQRFVAELAGRLGVAFHTAQAGGGKSDEASLRSTRMAFLVATAKATGCRYLALAHSADDNVETVLHHLMRGTGPSGLAGIPPMRSIDDDLVLARPMLGLRRHAIRDYLRLIGQPWREDASNAESVYQRNWIRNELLPMIELRYPEAATAIDRAAAGMRDWRAMVDSAAQQWISESVARVTLQQIEIRRNLDTDSAPATTPTPVVIAGLQAVWDRAGWSRGKMGREHWLKIAGMIADRDSASGESRSTLPGNIDIRADGDWVRFTVCHD